MFRKKREAAGGPSLTCICERQCHRRSSSCPRGGSVPSWPSSQKSSSDASGSSPSPGSTSCPNQHKSQAVNEGNGLPVQCASWAVRSGGLACWRE